MKLLMRVTTASIVASAALALGSVGAASASDDPSTLATLAAAEVPGGVGVLDRVAQVATVDAGDAAIDSTIAGVDVAVPVDPAVPLSVNGVEV